MGAFVSLQQVNIKAEPETPKKSDSLPPETPPKSPTLSRSPSPSQSAGTSRSASSNKSLNTSKASSNALTIEEFKKNEHIETFEVGQIISAPWEHEFYPARVKSLKIIGNELFYDLIFYDNVSHTVSYKLVESIMGDDMQEAEELFVIYGKNNVVDNAGKQKGRKRKAEEKKNSAPKKPKIARNKKSTSQRT